MCSDCQFKIFVHHEDKHLLDAYQFRFQTPELYTMSSANIASADSDAQLVLINII